MVQFIVFLVLTAGLLVFTLSRPHRHRWPRFVAFDSLLGLILLNGPVWFSNPFSPMQIVSWVFLIGSAALAVHGFRLLRSAGKPDEDWENTTQLITTGAYAYIRHPLYCSLLLLGIGAFLKNPSLPGGLILAVVVIGVVVTGRVEEQENLARFGDAYGEYMANTKMLIPFIL